MKAVVWHGKEDIKVDNVDDPKILNPHDIIVKVSLTAICGSDLHLYGGHVAGMRDGDILGHEFMGEVVETGSEVKNLHIGDRVVVPFAISCGQCFFCSQQMFSLCDNSNPNAWLTEKAYGFAPAGMFGYSHMMGGYAGGQAEYVRVPYADIGPIKVPDSLEDEKVLFLSDILPTGYMAAENCQIKEGDIVAIWGAGPVGQFAATSALLLGAHKVILIDNFQDRLQLARVQTPSEWSDRIVLLNYEEVDVIDAIKTLTGGRGADSCIDAVGMEAHGTGFLSAYDKATFSMKVQSDRPTALRQAIQACRKGGTISIPGAYVGFIHMVPMGSIFNKGLQIKTGQTHVQKYMKPLLEHIERGAINPASIISHRMSLDEAPQAYELFRSRTQGCHKVVLRAA
jgi:threonine dehydrogenase-like Zn-dependent dehydrogenase